MDNAIGDAISAAIGQDDFHFHGKEDDRLRHEVENILKFYGIQDADIIPESSDVDEMIENITAPLGVMRRHIALKTGWWKGGDGAILAEMKETGELVALIPAKFRGYYYEDYKTGNQIKITDKNHGLFNRDAIVFYKPLPLKPLTKKELLMLLWKNVKRVDMMLFVVATFVTTALGLLTPAITKMVFDQIIPTGRISLVLSMTMLLTVTAVSAYYLTTIRGGFLGKVKDRMEVYLVHGVMGRVMNLPPSFFEKRSTGSLFNVISHLSELPKILIDSTLVPVLNTLFSGLFVLQTAYIAPPLLKPTAIMFVMQLFIIVISWMQQSKLIKTEFYYDSKIKELALSVYQGIERVRLSASESRVIAKWSELYRDKASAAYPAVFPASFRKELLTLTTMLGTLYVYYVGYHEGIDTAEFAAFVTAFGFINANMVTMTEQAELIPKLSPTLDLIEDILQEVPETSSDKSVVSKLSGAIDVRELKYRYEGEPELVLNGVDFKVKPGEYVAIVGESGCGKSTLMRLLMGLDEPESGGIFYDDRSIEQLDPRSLRRNIGAVMQNGGLYVGDIFSNISIAEPNLTMERAWEIAEMVGLADDIRKMPMGMKTMIPQGGAGFSGGQKQRIMIASAIASNPGILIFDEATSALDNITQKIVSESLDKLNCTRIVIAHRLSTIKNCDRILVMDKGRIVEDGTFDYLVRAGGYFASLIERQQL